jgi:dTDP-4-amino-4,6-dideoxygalactose transaminase
MEPLREELPLFKVFIAPDAGPRAAEVLASGAVTQGPLVDAFERKLAAFLDNPHVLSLNSGTSALHIALHMLKTPDAASRWPGLKPGDEVLTTALTCAATNWPILANGLRPRWVDVDAGTANVDVKDLRRKLTRRTKVIQFVHWGGTPVDLDAIERVREYAEKKFGFRPAVIEDAAHAIGAEWNGIRVGAASRGTIAIFSLQAIKHLTTGDGGLLALPTKAMYDRAKVLRWYGISRARENYDENDYRLESDVKEFGFKMHMNDLAAAVGLANLPHLETILASHRANASYYDSALRGIDGVTLLNDVPRGASSSYWMYSFHVRDKPAFITFMKSKNVATSQVHARNDTHSVCAPFRTPLPVLDEVVKTLVSVPVGWWVTRRDREYVVEAVKAFFETTPAAEVSVSSPGGAAASGSGSAAGGDRAGGAFCWTGTRSKL